MVVTCRPLAHLDQVENMVDDRWPRPARRVRTRGCLLTGCHKRSETLAEQAPAIDVVVDVHLEQRGYPFRWTRLSML